MSNKKNKKPQKPEMNNTEETRRQANVMLAFANGKRIQIKSKDSLWTDVSDDSPSWNWDLYDYRIAPTQDDKVPVVITSQIPIPPGYTVDLKNSTVGKDGAVSISLEPIHYQPGWKDYCKQLEDEHNNSGKTLYYPSFCEECVKECQKEKFYVWHGILYREKSSKVNSYIFLLAKLLILWREWVGPDFKPTELQECYELGLQEPSGIVYPLKAGCVYSLLPIYFPTKEMALNFTYKNKDILEQVVKLWRS